MIAALTAAQAMVDATARLRATGVPDPGAGCAGVVGSCSADRSQPSNPDSVRGTAG